MAPDATAVLDEAYQRLHETGPEYEGWLSNHGPMAAEAMARHGHGAEVGRWLDGYVRRLEEFPRGSGRVGADWREALGDPKRIADWTVFFQREVTEQPWRRVAHPATGVITGPRWRRSRPERKHRHTSHITPTGSRYHIPKCGPDPKPGRHSQPRGRPSPTSHGRMA